MSIMTRITVTMIAAIFFNCRICRCHVIMVIVVHCVVWHFLWRVVHLFDGTELARGTLQIVMLVMDGYLLLLSLLLSLVLWLSLSSLPTCSFWLCRVCPSLYRSCNITVSGQQASWQASKGGSDNFAWFRHIEPAAVPAWANLYTHNAHNLLLVEIKLHGGWKS